MDFIETKILKLFLKNHFYPNENKNERQTILQGAEIFNPMPKKKKQASQTHDGKNVGKENKVGIAGNAKDSGHTIYSKKHIGKFNQHKHHKQYGSVALSLFYNEELPRMLFLAYSEKS